MTFGSQTFLGATLLALVLFACTVDAHGWLSSPSPRGQYLTPKKQSHLEYAPTAGNSPNSQEFICRNDPVMPKASWLPLTAGKSQSITLEFNAIHPGDCFVYLTYDGDKPTNEMKWFKIWQQHECYKKTNYDVVIPSYLPSGEHVIFRWEWYALHAFPTVEYYTQCVDAVITGSSSGSLPLPQVNIPGHLPTLIGDFLRGTNNYWWPYDNQVQFFTGPLLATLSGTNPTTPAPTTTPKPTLAPTKAPTTAPTTRPTSAPTGAPSTAPTTRPTSAPTTAPTSAPTKAPTSAPTSNPGTGETVKVGLNGGSSEWWVGVIVSGGGETTVKVELKDSSSSASWVSLVDMSYAYTISADVPLQAPLSLRLTSSSGKQVVLTNVLSSFSTNGLIDSGKSYTSSSTPATQAPTTTPAATAAPTVKPTDAPTAAPTNAPTNTPTSVPTTTPSNTVILVVNPSSSNWWYAVSFSGYRSTEITKVEIKDSGVVTSFSSMVNDWGNVFTFNPSNSALVFPLTVKASLASGSSISFTVSSLSATTVNSGQIFP